MEGTEEQEAIDELKAMSREELDNVEYDLKKWGCQCKRCTNGTKVRDYGISPEYYLQRGGGQWINLTRNYWLCGKHNKLFKRLLKSFSKEVVFDKIIDNTMMPLDKLTDINFTKSNKINEKEAI